MPIFLLLLTRPDVGWGWGRWNHEQVKHEIIICLSATVPPAITGCLRAQGGCMVYLRLCAQVLVLSAQSLFTPEETRSQRQRYSAPSIAALLHLYMCAAYVG